MIFIIVTQKLNSNPDKQSHDLKKKKKIENKKITRQTKVFPRQVQPWSMGGER